MSTVNSATSSTAATPATTLNASPVAKKTLGAEDFLKLLTVQLSSQDPLKPMEDTAFIAQMASFTSLEQMRTLTESFGNFAKDQKLSEANTYLGKTVTLTDSTGADQTGTVTALNLQGGTPKIVLNGKFYDLSTIKAVAAPAPTTANVVTNTSTDTTKGTN